MAKPCDMKVLEVKTARFAVLVEKCGAPEVYNLWQKPEADRKFQSLIKNPSCRNLSAPSGAMDCGLTNPARAGMQQR